MRNLKEKLFDLFKVEIVNKAQRFSRSNLDRLAVTR